ncbi:MAG: hypothetical protein LC687_06585 [Actinobacteria bacterium]|nr:hypothetical protein [Actinomycetota bacterium]MCA1807495.1 hypothetical protein [Actinomycetota bacterium]
MMKHLAHDVLNDVTLVQTEHKLGLPTYHVRYGLQITPFVNLNDAMKNFLACQLHALTCEGYDMYGSNHPEEE